MESESPDELDITLAELRSALERVHAPNIKDRIIKRHDERTPASVTNVPRLLKWWIPVGLAASFALVAIGSGILNLDEKSENPTPAHNAMPGYLVTYTQIPITVHSLSRGAELRYLDSGKIHDERGLTRVVYIHLPKKD